MVRMDMISHIPHNTVSKCAEKRSVGMSVPLFKSLPNALYSFCAKIKSYGVDGDDDTSDERGAFPTDSAVPVA